jgi:hypothetical protein
MEKSGRACCRRPGRPGAEESDSVFWEGPGDFPRQRTKGLQSGLSGERQGFLRRGTERRDTGCRSLRDGRRPTAEFGQEIGFQQRENYLSRPEGAHKWVSGERRDQIRPADDQAGLRPAKQLVPRKTNQIGAGPQQSGRGWFGLQFFGGTARSLIDNA